MRITIFIAAIVCCLSSPVSAEPTPAAIEKVMVNTVERFIRPGYEKFGDAVSGLEGAIEKLCSVPTGENLSAARDAFDIVAQSWAGIEIIRFGPISEDNRFERVLFYPDRKSTGLKQVQRILAKQDETAVKVERLENKSVAVQGLGAVEFILFGTGSETLESGDDFRCSYGHAVAKNLVNIADILTEGWSAGNPQIEIWTRPGPENPVLKNAREVVNELLGTWVHGLETIRDIRIGAFLRKEIGKDWPRVAIFRRSGNTMPVIAANIVAIRDMLVHSDASQLLEEEDKYIFDNILFELQQAESVAKELTMPVAELVNDEKQRSRLEYLRTSVKFTITMLDQDFAQATGLSSGFSFSDGD